MEARASGPLGINGLGRIGKLTLWHHVARGYFPSVVVNVGRSVGRGLEAVCQSIEKDSTYGSMHRFLFGVNAEPCIRVSDPDSGAIEVNGVPVKVLQEARDPRDIGWREHGVRLVVDTTGAFGDPTHREDHAGGSVRGHLAAGAERVIYSTAFKIKDQTLPVPDDVVTLIYGINHECFDAGRHRLVSAASCTTTGLAHMIKPLLDRLDPSTIMTASMSTVHAVTNTQRVLDGLPSAGARDLRKSRSALNSIILTSTNAARALESVIPAIKDIGFMADSVRIPVPTESLIILNVTFQSRVDGDGKSNVSREALNRIYAEAAAGPQAGLLVYSDEQNVSADVTGMKAAIVIEGVETHTRTGFVLVDLSHLPGLDPSVMARIGQTEIRVPVTHAKIFGWYDNEYGSYTNLMGDLTVHVDQAM
ncbi:MAG TPA: glyceraldehyde 3-phosphate dehydrogenase NAD-binding domain-containing protein [Longimicrobiales bacterium]|nr:glyceraldehyde 3-phosphate dehydrogenase NAD-binding domain-containing protein [Longimicrobiales bacterium]